MANMITFYYLGKKYSVPEGVTILSAMEYAGYRMIRGCGCRGGFCGACATVYRLPGDHEIKVGLACQTQVEEGMQLAVLPFYPANKANYDLQSVDDPVAAIRQAYPEVFRCLGCNACTKICPQDLPVMNYIAAVQRGDLKKAAELSFDCIMCGLCASRCLAQMVPYNVAMLARRLYAKFHLQKPDYIAERLAEIKAGKYLTKIDRLIEAGPDEMRRLYAQRDIEAI